jgi:hypothetical protein
MIAAEIRRQRNHQLQVDNVSVMISIDEARITKQQQNKTKKTEQHAARLDVPQ